MSIALPEGFVLGASTSAPQIEGAAGRGTSIWDTFAAQPGRVERQDGGASGVVQGKDGIQLVLAHVADDNRHSRLRAAS